MEGLGRRDEDDDDVSVTRGEVGLVLAVVCSSACVRVGDGPSVAAADSSSAPDALVVVGCSLCSVALILDYLATTEDAYSSQDNDWHQLFFFSLLISSAPTQILSYPKGRGSIPPCPQYRRGPVGTFLL